MAGFAVAMTILIDTIIGVVCAAFMSFILFFFFRKRIRAEQCPEGAALSQVTTAPFLGLLWLVVALLCHVWISNHLALQDCGLSGDPYVTLPNGYVLGSANTYDGYFQAPEAHTDRPVVGPGYVRSIVQLQLANAVFSGTQFDFESSTLRRFTFDTRTKVFQAFPIGPVTWSAANDEAQGGNHSYWKLYAQYRHSWPTWILLLLIASGEGAIVYWIWQIWTGPQIRATPAYLSD